MQTMQQQTQQRRSCRIALSIPIRVYGIDFRAKEFVEDADTLVVNLHGAKIRLVRQLIPDQEIRLLSFATRQESVFRVVSQVPGSEDVRTFWGVECLDPKKNIWGVRFPELQQRDQSAVRAMLQCPHCMVRELIYLDEPLLETLEHSGGLSRGCLSCKQTGEWKIVPYFEY